MSGSIEVSLSGRRGSFELDLGFSVPGSGVTVVFGRSGAGKTTLLRALSGLDRMPGRVVVGEAVWQDSADGRFLPTEERRLGYVFQEAALFPHLSVRENLQYGQRRARGQSSLSVDSVAALLDLPEALDRRPRTLSGGERQRVAIGRALLSSPVLLLMDEPIAALDVGARAVVLQHLEKIRAEARVPIVYVTHAIDEVVRLADRVLWLDQGRVRGLGAPGEIFGRLDFGMALGDEAGGVVDAVVRHHDHAYDLTEVDSAWGPLVIPLASAREGAPIRLRVKASDVGLSRTREHQSSISNLLSAVVREIGREDSGQVLVQVSSPADDSLRLLARVTRRSVDKLGLEPGSSVYLLVKSVSVR